MIHNPVQFPRAEAHWTLSGPAGKLEITSFYPNRGNMHHVAVICHPHPLFGGTMHNKVVYTVAKAFKELQWPHLRFNFRGVEQSEGEYAEGIGETTDLITVLNWIKQVMPGAAIYLVGFSFGAYVALRAAQQRVCTQLILIAPPVKNFNFAAITASTSPCLIIQGEQDEIVAAQAVLDWAAHLTSPVAVIRFPTASHFFHGQLLELRQAIVDYIKMKDQTQL